MWEESFVFTFKCYNRNHKQVDGRRVLYNIAPFFKLPVMQFLPGALRGVVGGAGVLKGSKSVGSILNWVSSTVGRR